MTHASLPMVRTLPLLRPGLTCFRTARAQRAACLIDAEAAFAAMVAAMAQARASILCVGWDFEPRIRLLRRGPDAADGETMDQVFTRLLDASPGLQVRMLTWTYGITLGLHRRHVPPAALPRFLRPALRHPRLHLAVDTNHPWEGAHHQKIIIIDDSVAFCGGLDLTAERWDTPAHADDDPRRVDPGVGAYAPYHDMCMVVDGAAARTLGAVARARWQAATGDNPPTGAPTPHSRHADRWPAMVTPEFRNVDVGVARSAPPRPGQPAAGEIEALLAAAIRAARHGLYIESQYLAAHRLCAELCARLVEPDGPDIVLITPPRANSVQEELTLGAVRDHMVRKLRHADRHGRLRILHPVTAAGRPIIAHAKVLICDDRLLRVGSANFANRSLGLDTECDVVIEAVPGLCDDPEATARAIRAVQVRLLAEHMDVPEPTVAEALNEPGRRLAATIDTLRRDHGKTLRPVLADPPLPLVQSIIKHRLFDPPGPRSLATLFRTVGRILMAQARKKQG